MSLDELLAAARAEDPRARSGRASRAFWAAVTRELREFLRGHKRSDADDIIQATTEVVCAKLETYKQTGPDSLVRWIRVIASYKSREHARTQNGDRVRISRLRAQPNPAPATSPTSWVLRRERARLVATQLERLPTNQRIAIAHKLGGEHDRTLAERESISIRTVWTRRHSGLSKVIAGLTTTRRTPVS